MGSIYVEHHDTPYEVSAWWSGRDESRAAVEKRFTAEDGWEKLGRLYPSPS